VEGAQTENAPGTGAVLGDETSGDAGQGWIGSHPWWTTLIILVLLALGYYGYQDYQKKHNGNSQPK
jgi:hypothetical protein